MALDFDRFRPRGGVWESSTETEKDGGIDVFVQGDDEPSPAAFAALQAAADKLETLRPLGIAAAEAHRQKTYGWRCPAPEEWVITILKATADGVVVITFYEGEIDTYGAWDVSFRDGAALKVERRQI